MVFVSLLLLCLFVCLVVFNVFVFTRYRICPQLFYLISAPVLLSSPVNIFTFFPDWICLNSATSPRIVLNTSPTRLNRVLSLTFGLSSGTKTGMKTSQEQLGWLWNAHIINTFQVFGLLLWFSKSSTSSIKDQQMYWSWHQERVDSSSREKTSSFLKSVFAMQHFLDM